jgi:O-antigen/teichoic acid export membrane protein
LLSGGTALAQGVSVLLSPVITRLYTPANLGDFALFTSFLNVVLVGTSLKYELGIVSADSEKEAAQLGFLCLIFAIPLSLLSGVLLWFMVHQAWLGFGTLPRIAPLLVVPAACAGGAFVALRYWFIRLGRFGFVSNTMVLQHGGRAVTQAALGALGSGSLGLFWGEIIGRCAGLSRMLGMFWPSLRPHLSSSGLGEYRAILWKHRKLLFYSLGSSLLDTLAINMTIPLLVQSFGSRAGGHFALMQRVLAVPLALISSSVADAFHSRMAVHLREGPAGMLPFFHRTTLFLILAGGLPALLLLAAGPRLFALVFGSDWTLAGALAAVCVPWFLAQFIVSPLSRLVFVLRGQEFKLMYDAVAVLGVISVFAVARHLEMSFYHTVLALSIVNALAYAVYYSVLLRIVRRHPGRGPS